MYSGFKVMIGLEVHAQITSLKTKLFCSCPSNYREKAPNTNVCPVCLGLPGSLPVLNKKAIEEAVKVALALNSTPNKVLIFTRKHYFYPDLPKNYQISQYDGVGSAPLAKGGYIVISPTRGVEKVVRIRRINVEEDPGRIVYPYGSISASPYSLIDYNRSGIALLEIVTEPDLESPREARCFIQKLLSILEHLGVTDPKLEGAVRVDANVSVGGGERVEIKNIGSPKDVEKALAYEIARQLSIIRSGGKVIRETRHWDKSKGVTIAGRAKELEEDYRYFPDPDLPAIPIDKSLIDKLLSELPELPDERVNRLIQKYGLTRYVASVIVTSGKDLADFFEEVVRQCGSPQLVSSILVNELLRWVDELNVDLREGIKRLNKDRLCKIISYYNNNLINIKLLKNYIKEVIVNNAEPEALVRQGYVTIRDYRVLEAVIDEVIRENPKAVSDALKNPKVINYLVGQVMLKTKGRADPRITNELIVRRLRSLGNVS